MWDDLPRKNSAGTKTLIIIVVILAIGAIGYAGYTLFASKSEENTLATSSPLPSESLKISGAPSPTPSASTSASLSPSPTIDYKVPEGETFATSSQADTNGDGKLETLVITKMTSGKYHAYVLSSDGKSVFDNKELLKKPARITLQTFDITKESYLSWMLVFTENSGDLSFIHWNGTAYEIPQNSGI